MSDRLSAERMLFHQGKSFFAYEYLGAHLRDDGALFRTFAPNAVAVSVVGGFNAWNPAANVMKKIDENGIWECFVEGAAAYDSYKYHITTGLGDTLLKCDPFAFHSETIPNNASMIYDISGFEWSDSAWQNKKKSADPCRKAMNIYEFNFASWRKYEDGSYFDYIKSASELSVYLKDMGYTHVELMPILEYENDHTFGYQTTGYFAPSSRFGTPKDLMKFVDIMHTAGIGVILDWTVSGFYKNDYGLASFDGSSVYEYSDPRKSEYPHRKICVFDYSKPQVISFLSSCAVYWVEMYHIDALRINSLSSMLYLDYDRIDSGWVPNIYGGKENLEAIELIRLINTTLHEKYPGTLTIAEETTAWPLITKPIAMGGLGFDFKWNTSWKNDILRYASLDPIHRKYNHDSLTFSFVNAFGENYILPITHDDVIGGKGSLISKMPGDYNMKFDGLRALLAFIMMFPGKKMMSMGQEFAQVAEWNNSQEIDWPLLEILKHRMTHSFVKKLNSFYLSSPPLWENDSSWDTFRWIANDDCDQSIIAFRRIDRSGNELICVCNFVPVERENYRIGVPSAGKYRLVLNTDDEEFGGSGMKIDYTLKSENIPFHKMKQSISLNIPALSVMIFEYQKPQAKALGDGKNQSKG